MIENGVMGCKSIIELGFEKAMNIVNVGEEKPKPIKLVKKEDRGEGTTSII